MFEVRKGVDSMIAAGYIIVFAYLCLMTWYDLKKREISLRVSAVVAFVLSARQLFLVCQKDELSGTVFLGIMIGFLLIFISLLSRGEIGIGDGILFIVTGLLFGIYENTVLLFLSLLFAALISGILLVSGRVGRKYSLPFAPFVFVGFGVMCLWKICV